MRTINLGLGLSAALASVLALSAVGCSGDDGKPGEPGAPGAPGPAGPAGPSGNADAEPEVDLVFPNTGILGRQVDVVVRADDLKLEEGTKLEFGPGVRVANVELLSSRSVSARLTIEPEAAVGLRDVTITVGDKKVVGTKAFRVRPGIDVGLSAQTLESGSILAVQLTNNDRAAFDTTQGRFTVLSEDPFVLFGLQQLTATNARVLFLLPPSMTLSQPTRFIAANRLGGQPVDAFISAPLGVTVTKREPTTFESGTAIDAVFDKPLATRLFKVASTGPAIVDVDFSKTGTDVNPEYFMFGADGTEDDVLLNSAQNPRVTLSFDKADSHLFMAYDRAFGGGADAAKFGFRARATVIPATLVEEDDTEKFAGAAAQVIALDQLPVVVRGAQKPPTAQNSPRRDVYRIDLASPTGIIVALEGDATEIQNVRLTPNADLTGGGQPAAITAARPYATTAAIGGNPPGAIYIVVTGQPTATGTEPYKLSIRALTP
jgi:hypothetical protein